MTTLERIVRGWFRGKRWKAKRERRLQQWQSARWRDAYRLPPQQVSRWEVVGDGIIKVEGVYHHWRGFHSCAQSFDVIKVEGVWRYRFSGGAVDCKQLLSYLGGEEIKRKYPDIFNPEVKSDS